MRLDSRQNAFADGPGVPRWGSLQRSPSPLSWIWRKERSQVWRKGQAYEGEGKVREREG